MYLGMNGENWFQAEDPISRQWVIESILPGQTFTLRFRADKPGFLVDELDKLISLSQDFEAAGRHLAVIYCINVKELPDMNFNRVQQVIEAGVDVIAIELGNEVYSSTQANFDADLYISWINPLRNLINAHFPAMPILVFLAPRPNESGVLGGRSEHSMFNDKIINLINNDNTNTLQPVVHIYFNSKECPVLLDSPAKRVIDSEIFDADLEAFYTTLKEQALNNLSLWDKTLYYLKSRMPNKDVYITEWGFDNYGNIKNTIGLGEVAWNIWNTYGRDVWIKALLQHNGLSMALPGMICPANKNLDLNPDNTPNIRRIDYWVWRMFREISDEYLKGQTDEVGVFYNLYGSGFGTTEPGLVIMNTYTSTIGGEHLYSSAGATEWMDKTSGASMEVKGITEGIPKTNAFGYNKYVVEKVLANNLPPVAVIEGPTNVYVGDPVTLTSTSTDPDGTIISTKWSINGTVTSQAITYQTSFYSPGDYAVYLEVTDNKGDKNTTVIEIKAINKPVTQKPWWCKYPSIVALFKRLGINTSKCE